jgi:hypothetical protein
VRIVVAFAVVLSLTGCQGGQEPPAVPVATDRCAAPVFPPLQFGSHLLGDTEPPVPYSSTPPTSGWHASGAIPIGINELTAPQQVSVLESGAVVVTHRGLPAEEQDVLEDLATAAHDGRLAVTPFDALADGEVVLAAWGVLQRCDGVDVEAVSAFVETYAAEDPAVPGLDEAPRTTGPAAGAGS